MTVNEKGFRINSKSKVINFFAPKIINCTFTSPQLMYKLQDKIVELG